MILRLGLALLFVPYFYSCSEISSDVNVKEISSSIAEGPISNVAIEEFSFVCGVLFKVSKFETWQEEYNKSAKNAITLLRFVDDPSYVIVFESMQSLGMAEKRASQLMQDGFLTSAGVEGSPVATFFNVQYFKPPDKDYEHFVALSFIADDFKQWFGSMESNISLFANNGLTPMGIGTNPKNPNDVYVLSTLDDFVALRKNSNSPRKINRLMDNLNLPRSTVISYWSKPRQ